jgi:hypothetical protein
VGETWVWTDPATREAIEASMSRLSRIERRLYGPMMVREMRGNPRADAEYERFGPEGLVFNNCSRAAVPYMFGAGLLMAFLLLIHADLLANTSFVTVLAFGAFAMRRALQAKKLGRSWRYSGDA